MGAGQGRTRRASAKGTASPDLIITVNTIKSSGGPAKLAFQGLDDDGYVKESWRDEQYEQHRDNDEPAFTTHSRDGKTLRSQEWYQHGLLDREGKPAQIFYNSDGLLRERRYCKDGKRHREDGPARITYRPDGSELLEEYYEDGALHREDGAARIRYAPDGSVEQEEY